MIFDQLLQAAGAAGSSNLLVTVLPFALIILIFYFLILRPQNKKQKQTEKMIAALKKGDKVITIGGIHGVVSSTKDQTVIVKVDDNAKIEFSRSAIATVVVDKVEKKSDKKEKVVEEKTETKEATKLDGAEVTESSETTK